MTEKAVQDYYPDDIAVCYGCDKSNEHGYQIKTYWEGEETVRRLQPESFQMVISVTLSAKGKETARGKVVALKIPEDFLSK